jgi:hypothetical protein
MAEGFGAKCIATNDSLQLEDLAPKAKDDHGWI